MILVKTVIEGKEVYAPISFEDALKYEDKSLLVFTDEDEKDHFEDTLEEMEEAMEEVEEAKSDLEEMIEDFSSEFEDCLHDFGEKVEKRFGDFDKVEEEVRNVINHSLNSVGSILSNFTKMDKGSLGTLAMLPFMDDEDIHEIVNEILAGNPKYQKVNFTAMMPFLTTEDCDRIFINVLKTQDKENRLVSLAPFVSSECLSEFVDLYVTGQYSDVNVEALYPFMDGKDVRKLFDYFLDKED